MRHILAIFLFLSASSTFAVTTESWQGEWGSWTKKQGNPFPEYYGGNLSISDCKGDACTVSLQLGNPVNSSSCSAYKMMLSVSKDAKSADFSFFKPSEYAPKDEHPCQIRMTFDDTNPPVLHAVMSGKGCSYYCTPDVPPFIDHFPLKSKAVYSFESKPWCYSSAGAELFCSDNALVAEKETYESKAERVDEGQHVNQISDRKKWFEAMVEGCSKEKTPGPCMKDKLDQQLADIETGLKAVAQREQVLKLAGDKVAGNKLIDEIAGVYKVQFENGDVQGDKFRSEDILELVRIGESAMYFKVNLNFYNGHECNLYGVANYRANGAFVFEDSKRDTSGNQCELIIEKTEKDLVLQEVAEHSCKAYCGARGSFSDDKFPISRKREIKYMDILKKSAEYKLSVEHYQQTKVK